MKRAELKTEAAPIDKRLALWEDAVKATHKSIQLAERLQKTGLDVLKQIDAASHNNDADSDKLVSAYSKALANIAKGVVIERDARKELIELNYAYPKK